MRTQSYPSDVTDAQWALIEPQLPVYPGGRPRKTDLRDVVNAIFYLLRTGCQWRYLPKDFPPKSTVWRYFDEWRHNGTLDTIHDLLRKKVRTAEKPYEPRTTASVDSQSVDTTSGGEQRGRDNAKNVDGRKRHIVVDSMGLLLAVLVTAASVDDGAAAAELFARLEGQPESKVRRVFAGRKYHHQGRSVRHTPSPVDRVAPRGPLVPILPGVALAHRAFVGNASSPCSPDLSRKENLMTPLRQRMLQDMQMRNLSPHTLEAYVRAVAR